MKPTTVRACGVAIALGGIIWSLGWLQAGVPEEGVNNQVEIWASGVFQLGLVALLTTMRATNATGTTRWGRFVLNAEIVALALAIAWTIPFLFDANRPNTGILVVLDAFWPLSMVGLIVVGVQTIRAGRWPAPARYLPLVASLLLPVDIVLIVTGTSLWTQVVARALYLAVAYASLGLAVISQVAPLTARMTPSTTAHSAPDSTA